MSTRTEPPQARDAAYWARPVDKLQTSDIPAGALNINVDGKPLTGPIRGFGQMWQKTYRVRLTGQPITPQAVIADWKQNFSSYWPKGNTLYVPAAGIVPGETAVINTKLPGNIPVMATGVRVIYADDESFAYMTPAGHPFNGMITSSAFDDDGITTAQVQLLVRPYDPLYELGFRLRVLSKQEDTFWRSTLSNLAARWNVQSPVDQKITLIDPIVQWSEARNIWQNAGIRTALYMLAAPFRWVARQFKRAA
jgi:hypothetical protein